MRTEKNTLIEESSGNLFQDKYGILQLAANATLTRAPRSLKIIRYFRLKLAWWANSVLVFIKKLWVTKGIGFSG